MTLTNKEVVDWIKHLKEESQEAFDTAYDLYKSKRYHFALFFCHLAVEKLIKAYFLSKKKKFAAPVHDLIYLVKKTGIKIDKETLAKLAEMNSFNIRARYEDYKREFYKRSTLEYAKEWLKTTTNLLDLFKKYESSNIS